MSLRHCWVLLAGRWWCSRPTWGLSDITVCSREIRQLYQTVQWYMVWSDYSQIGLINLTRARPCTRPDLQLEFWLFSLLVHAIFISGIKWHLVTQPSAPLNSLIWKHKVCHYTHICFHVVLKGWRFLYRDFQETLQNLYRRIGVKWPPDGTVLIFLWIF